MRTLHVITGLGTGGAEQQLRLLLRHLPVHSDVVTLTNPGAVARGLTADGVRVTHLGMTGNRDLGALPRLTRLVREGRYDVVHTHLYRACVYGRFAARLAGVRAVVATEHSLGESQMEGRPLSAGVRALYLAGERMGRATLAVSPSVAERLARWGVPRHRVHVVPNGIDVDRFAHDPERRAATRHVLGLHRDDFVIGGVGRLVPGKRFDVVVRALAQLPDYVRLLLVGGGPEEERLRGLARELGVTRRVVFAGERPYASPSGRAGDPDLPALMSAMDLLASPSADEAFGLAVVEALAAGLPVLYVTCPAVDDLPPHLETAAVRVPGDPESFAREALRIVAARPSGRAPSPAARHYSIARSAEQHLRLYEAAMDGARSTARDPDCPIRLSETPRVRE
ncbi:glycosyltransferase [Streptomyces antnestii]|uniref:D-inositol 3-phosphate glycosyltransferase n=1 Tax=Streptomyces antnestii TaxID=2494256 RepID=A0A3S3UIP6_9ACTN|nr:glycosyltransferase [Streptomyces sp. San01]RVU27583.1 glycosyltransferase [Streptomyces sp. San01]